MDTIEPSGKRNYNQFIDISRGGGGIQAPDSDPDSDDEVNSNKNDINHNSDEEDFQREVDEIINSVLNLDMGDAKSNKAMHNKMTKYRDVNRDITDQLSQRSGMSRKSFKSHFSRKSKQALGLGS